MTKIEEKLAELGRWTLLENKRSFYGDIDGWDIQDKAKHLGLLVPVTVTEPCGEDCLCADFPLDCLRFAEGVEP